MVLVCYARLLIVHTQGFETLKGCLNYAFACTAVLYCCIYTAGLINTRMHKTFVGKLSFIYKYFYIVTLLIVVGVVIEAIRWLN